MIKNLFIGLGVFFVLLMIPAKVLATTYCNGSTSYTYPLTTCEIDTNGCFYCKKQPDGSGIAPCGWVGGLCKSYSDVVSTCLKMSCLSCSDDLAGYAETGDCWTCTSVDGGWSDWSDDCSSACGQSITRTCTNPAPSCGGAGCSGSSSGSCPNDDGGAPTAPTLISPIGSSLAPVIVASGVVTLDWNAVAKADKYSVLVQNLGTGITLWKNNIISSDVGISGLSGGNVYSWKVRGINTTCGDETGTWSGLGYFQINTAPTFTNLTIKNSDGTVVAAESGNKNHLCQSDFYTSSNNRRAIFEANVNDVDGWLDLNNAILRWNGNDYPMSKISGLGTGATMRAIVDFNSGNNDPLTYPLSVNVFDNEGGNSGFIDTTRQFKVWNCQVSVSGTLYDGSLGQACNNTGFTLTADSEMGFSSLIYKNIGSSGDVTMSTALPANYGANNIVFAGDYLPIFNGGNVSNPDGSLMVTGRLTRIIDLGTGTTYCPTATQFNLGSSVSAYSSNPQARVDFSFIRSQAGWFQVSGAGVKAKNEVGSGVPLTADASSRALSITGILADNGLVSFSTYSNINGNNNNTDYGLSHNWWINRSTNDPTSYSYQYFYNNFYINRDIGVIGSDWVGKPSEGVYFVNGNLNIDSDFILPPDIFFMVIVRGSLTIADTVNRLDGIYIADGGITASGFSDTQLVINGMLYSRNNIRLSRSYVNKILNNTLPAVKVNYQPDLLFNMSGTLMRVLSGWREE